MKTINIMALCMVMACVSLLGFVVENIWLAITKGYMDNRNMFFPFLIGYGIAMLLIYLILGTPKKLLLFGKAIRIQNKVLKWLVYFMGVMICICVGEIVLGFSVEKICRFYWWDYSCLPLHITRYTSVPTSAMFSLMVTVFMDKIFRPLFLYFRNWDYNVLSVCASVLVILMVGDFFYNGYKMYKTRDMVRRWRIDTTGSRLYRILHT